jgi:hypothetical protein
MAFSSESTVVLEQGNSGRTAVAAEGEPDHPRVLVPAWIVASSPDDHCGMPSRQARRVLATDGTSVGFAIGVALVQLNAEAVNVRARKGLDELSHAAASRSLPPSGRRNVS